MKTKPILLLVVTIIVLATMSSCQVTQTPVGPAFGFNAGAINAFAGAAIMGTVAPRDRPFVAMALAASRPVGYRPMGMHVQAGGCVNSVFTQRPSYYNRQPFGNPMWNARFGGCSTPMPRGVPASFVGGVPVGIVPVGPH